MDELKTVETEEDRSTTTCRLCLAAPSRYTCPRCNVRYCTAECYRCEAHLQCSELFYRQCFIEGMHGMNADSKERRHMMQMLQRLEDQDQQTGSDLNSAEEDEVLDKSQSETYDFVDDLADIDLDAEDDVTIWHRLPEKWKREFASMMKDGRIGELMDIWHPWWLDPPRLIEEIDADSSVLQTSNLPCILQLSFGCGQNKSSPAIRFGILSTLYSYAYAARLYNGEHTSAILAEEASHLLVAMSPEGSPVMDVSSTIAGCLTAISKLEAGAYFVSRAFSISVIEDVAMIVAALDYTLMALSECHELVRTAKKSSIDANADRIDKRDGAAVPGKKKTVDRKQSAKEKILDISSNVDISGKTRHKTMSTHVIKSRAGDLSEAKNRNDNKSKSFDSTVDVTVEQSHRARLFRLQKKLEFYIAWVRALDCGTGVDAFSALRSFVEHEFCVLSSELAQHDVDEKNVNKLIKTGKLRPVPPAHKLIEEVDNAEL